MTLTKKLVLGAAALALAAGAILAKGLAPRPGQAGAFVPDGRRLELLATYLGLSEAQKKEARAIAEAAHKQAQQIIGELKSGHEEMAAAVKSGKSEAEIDHIAAAQGERTGRFAAVAGKAMANFYALLTPEQKDKLEKLRTAFRGRIAERLGVK